MTAGCTCATIAGYVPSYKMKIKESWIFYFMTIIGEQQRLILYISLYFYPKENSIVFFKHFIFWCFLSWIPQRFTNWTPYIYICSLKSTSIWSIFENLNLNNFNHMFSVLVLILSNVVVNLNMQKLVFSVKNLSFFHFSSEFDLASFHTRPSWIFQVRWLR